MLGWKPIEKMINPSVSLEEAREALRAEGFEERVVSPEHITMRRSGTQLTAKGQEFPIDVAVAKAELGLFLQVRYGTFVLFDTGDLGKLADELAAKLMP